MSTFTYSSLSKSEESIHGVDDEEGHELLRTRHHDKAEYTQKEGSFLSRTWQRIAANKHISHFLILSHILTSSVYILIILYVSRHPTISIESYTRKFSTWSPALPAITYKPPSFFPAEIQQTNKFRGRPGERPAPSVDQAWQDVGVGVPGIRLSGEEIEGMLGKKLVDGTRKMHEVQDGKGGYVAMLEVMHLLHCLDELRKALFFNWDYYKDSYPNGTALETMQIHHDHCIDAIRLSLTCTADVTPVTFYDDSSIPARRLSLPDFSSRHTCRDFDAILKWNWETERAVMWQDVGDAVTFDPSLKEEENSHGHHHGGQRDGD